MQKGRERSAKKQRSAAVTRVLAFQEWLAADAEYSKQQRAFVEYAFPVKMRVKPRPPATGIPSDNDYKIARQEGAIT